ncbi:MAG TPA: hypothetical protein VII90_06455 [Anaerolineales bacterium]
MKVKQGRHSLPDISIFSAGSRIWTLPGGVEKWLSFCRKAVKKMERIPAFGGGKDPLKMFIHSEDRFVPDKKGGLV